ncbi:Protein yellow, partial [Pseudolycoriella hygida]
MQPFKCSGIAQVHPLANNSYPPTNATYKMRETVILVLMVAAVYADTSYGRSSPSFQWTGATFAWPCPSTKSLYRNSNKYISKNIIATRAQISGDDVYMALPRYKAGNPATLVKTNLREGSCHATLTPFPCWSMQEEGNCQAFQSVVDLYIDNNDILWILDVGIVQTLENPVRRCPPKVVAISLKSKKVLKVITLDGLTSKVSRLQYLAVDYSIDGKCFVYVSDASTRAIIVFDVQASRGFRVVLPKAVVSGSSRKDVLYLALVRKSCGSCVLYFTYLGSKRMFAIRTEYLRKGFSQGRITDVGIKPNKIVVIGTDNGSAIFFRNEGQSEVYRWDTNTTFEQGNFKPVYR